MCSKSCGGGTRTKSRRTDDNHHEDEPEHCPGMVNLEESCSPEECPGNILAYSMSQNIFGIHTYKP